MPRIVLSELIAHLGEPETCRFPDHLRAPLLQAFRAWKNHGVPVEQSLALRAPPQSETFRQKQANRRRLLRLAMQEVPQYVVENGRRRKLTESERLDHLAKVSARFQDFTWPKAGLRDTPPPGSSGIDLRIWQLLSLGYRLPRTRSGLWKILR